MTFHCYLETDLGVSVYKMEIGKYCKSVGEAIFKLFQHTSVHRGII